MTTGKFIYEVSVKAPEHTPENIEEIFGAKSCFISEYKEDVWAREPLGSVFQDAIVHCLEMKMSHIVENNIQDQDDFCEYQDEKIKAYETMRDSLKYVRKE